MIYHMVYTMKYTMIYSMVYTVSFTIWYIPCTVTFLNLRPCDSDSVRDAQAAAASPAATRPVTIGLVTARPRAAGGRPGQNPQPRPRRAWPQCRSAAAAWQPRPAYGQPEELESRDRDRDSMTTLCPAQARTWRVAARHSLSRPEP
jgi:hypothetical protein